MNTPDHDTRKTYRHASEAVRLDIKNRLGNSCDAAPNAASVDNAGVMIRPLRWYIGVWMLTVLLANFAHWPLLDHPVPVWVGLVLRLGGIAFGAWGWYTMRQMRINVCPRKSTQRVIAKGPFRISRNPLYVGFSIAMVGMVFVWNSAWGVLMLVPLLLVMHFGVVLREERYLGKKFGDEYREYCSQVRRYL